MRRGAAVAQATAFTLLNPHVYLDTVLARLTFRGLLNAFARNFPAVGSSGVAGGFQVDEALGLLLPGSHEFLDKALVVDGLLQ